MTNVHSVRLNRDLCVGCTNCIKGCPTEAIRVRDGKAVIDENRCIDCGECIRICPHNAKRGVTDPCPQFLIPQPDNPAIALVPPSLYAQFGNPATRSMVLQAIYLLGFDYVYEVALGAAASSYRTRELLWQKREKLAENPKLSSSLFPMISSSCPTAVRLIQMKYPGLISHLIPLDSPMEITARFAREEVAKKTGLPPENCRTYFLSPCPSKRSATLNPLGQKQSQVDFVLGIHEVYPMLLNALEKMSDKDFHNLLPHKVATACGVQWAASGGEAQSLGTEKYMSVDGIHNVISILEEIENERLKDIEFVELSCCFGGCIGGPLVVANPFSAKARTRGYVKSSEEEYRQNPEAFMPPETLDAQVWEVQLCENTSLQLDLDLATALDKYEQMEKILSTLPALDCGACGAPTCAALAEDIVQGNALETDCIIKLKEHIRQVAKALDILEL